LQRHLEEQEQAQEQLGEQTGILGMLAGKRNYSIIARMGKAAA